MNSVLDLIAGIAGSSYEVEMSSSIGIEASFVIYILMRSTVRLADSVQSNHSHLPRRFPSKVDCADSGMNARLWYMPNYRKVISVFKLETSSIGRPAANAHWSMCLYSALTGVANPSFV